MPRKASPHHLLNPFRPTTSSSLSSTFRFVSFHLQPPSRSSHVPFQRPVNPNSKSLCFVSSHRTSIRSSSGPGSQTCAFVFLSFVLHFQYRSLWQRGCDEQRRPLSFDGLVRFLRLNGGGIRLRSDGWEMEGKGRV